MQTIYEKSNGITEVRLNRLSSNEYKKLLSDKDRQKDAQRLVDYLCDKFKISKVSVCVTNKPQPHKHSSGRLRSKTLGLYIPSKKQIIMYNTTAVRRQTVSINVFADTLLHEFIHHYDFAVLKFSDSPHTAGFYKRISDLKAKLSK